jgi:hypothetical protein
MESKNTISQEAMGQTIDFNIISTTIHTYTVTNATDDNTTLRHHFKKMIMSFDGMGQKRSFDTENEKDMKGEMGKPFKEMKEKSYDMVIDSAGVVKITFPEKIVISAGDNQMAMISNMMKAEMGIVQPPKKETGSFFKILPGKELMKGDTWTDTYQNEDGKFNTIYSISDFTDSTILIDFTGSAVTVTKAEMMGNEMTTTMNTKSTGKIILDKATGIIREKTTNSEGTGNTEGSFGSLPSTSKNTTVINVAPAMQ